MLNTNDTRSSQTIKQIKLTMNINTDTLALFIAVAESRSFTKASEQLFLTQPAVSKRIAQLESTLNAKLFDRIGKQISLTEAGHELLPKAKAIIIEMDDLIRTIGNLSGEVRGELTIGTSHHIGLHRLPPHLKAFGKQFHEVKLNIKFMESEQIYEQVKSGSLELGIVTLPETPDTQLAVTRLWKDPLSFMVNNEHPLAQDQTTNLDQLLSYPAILPEPNTFTRKIVERIMASQSQMLDCGFSTNNLETIRMLTRIGLGWSVLPDTMHDHTLTQLKVINTSISRELGAVYHRHRTLSNAAQKILLQLQEPINPKSSSLL